MIGFNFVVIVEVIGEKGFSVGVETGAAVTLLAFFNSLPPEKPVTNRVVPTENKKTKVYFFDGSKFVNSVKGLELVLGVLVDEVVISSVSTGGNLEVEAIM